MSAQIFSLISLVVILSLSIYYAKASFEHDRYILQSDKTRMVHMAWDSEGGVRCRVVTSKNKIKNLVGLVKENSIRQVDGESMNTILDVCTTIEMHHNLNPLFNSNYSKGFTFPGTKWCGSGNTAEDYEDLGEYWETDGCCRKHDHCPDYIAVGQEKYGLVNKHLGTVSLCACDEEFYKCLKDTEHLVSDKMGNIFFNILGMPCFKFDHPIVDCVRWGGFGSSQCQEYVLDPNRPEKWQFFDAKEY